MKINCKWEEMATTAPAKAAHSQNALNHPLPTHTLADLGPGERAVIRRIEGDSSLKRRLSVLGLVRGTEIAVDFSAPLGDPRAYSIMGYQLSLRNEDARKIALQTAE